MKNIYELIGAETCYVKPAKTFATPTKPWSSYTKKRTL